MGRLSEAKGLGTSFFAEDGVVHAVNGLGYNLDEGEILAIVGESGCWKSVGVLSLLRLISMPPGRITAGDAWFGSGEDRRDLLLLPADLINLPKGCRFYARWTDCVDICEMDNPPFVPVVLLLKTVDNSGRGKRKNWTTSARLTLAPIRICCARVR